MVSYSWLVIEFAYRFLKSRPTSHQLQPFSWLSRRNTHRAVSSASSQHTEVEPERADDYLTRTQGKLLLIGLSVSTLFVFIRSVYRCPELLSGWNGPIIENQTLFDILDGACIVSPLPPLEGLSGTVADVRVNAFLQAYLLAHAQRLSPGVVRPEGQGTPLLRPRHSARQASRVVRLRSCFADSNSNAPRMAFALVFATSLLHQYSTSSAKLYPSLRPRLPLDASLLLFLIPSSLHSLGLPSPRIPMGLLRETTESGANVQQ